MRMVSKNAITCLISLSLHLAVHSSAAQEGQLQMTGNSSTGKQSLGFFCKTSTIANLLPQKGRRALKCAR